MARPWKHPKTGIYWLRRGVPADLRPLVGKREEKLSLRTRDPIEARRLFAAALVQVDERWKTLRERPPVEALAKAGLRELTEREAHELARQVHDDFLSHYREEPSQQTVWSVDIGPKTFTTLGTPNVLDLWRGQTRDRGQRLAANMPNGRAVQRMG